MTETTKLIINIMKSLNNENLSLNISTKIYMKIGFLESKEYLKSLKSKLSNCFR